MEDSDEELDKKTRDNLFKNEIRSFRNRAFHDGYDDGKNAVIQKAFDDGYQKAFEQNFILSTLKGVAQALKSSHNLNSTKLTTRPTSTTSSASTASPSPSPSSKHRTERGSNQLFGSSATTAKSGEISSSSSSSNVSNTTGSSNINISSNHLSVLESMKFDDASDIESIKNDLIKICRENRLEVLAHYVSGIG